MSLSLNRFFQLKYTDTVKLDIIEQDARVLITILHIAGKKKLFNI